MPSPGGRCSAGFFPPASASSPAAQGLGQLAHRHRGGGQAQDGPPLRPAEGHGGEHGLEGRQAQHGQLHGHAHQEGLVHGFIGEQADAQQALLLAAHVEGVEELADGQGGKGHGVGGGGGIGRSWEDVLPQEEGAQGEQAHHAPLPAQPPGKTPGEELLPRVPGPVLHHVLLHRLHPQGQGGQGVCDQVEPQTLR